jgi:uncharacterized integral membrane protein
VKVLAHTPIKVCGQLMIREASMKTANIIMGTITAILFTIWCIQKIEYALRPEGMKKSSYSVDTLIEI